MKRKEELVDAIENYLLDKESRTYSKTKRSEIKDWVNENYEIADGELKKKNIYSNKVTFFYY